MVVKDPVQELRETKVWKYLKAINSTLKDNAVEFVEKISPVLTTIKTYFPYYTRHDAHHGFRVLKRIEQIIKPECLQKGKEISFTEDEAFLLICSSYAHDLGMTVFPYESEEELSKEIRSINNIDTLQTHLRKHHSQRGGSYIAKYSDKIGIPKNLVSLLDQLMKSHNFSLNELEKNLGERYAAGENEIPLKQLACILCVADSLEFSETRVLDDVISNLQIQKRDTENPEIITSYRENMKHFCIGNGVAISQSDGKIIFSGTFDDPEILSLAHNTIDAIENWIRGYTDIDYGYKNPRLRIRTDNIKRTLEILGSDFERLGIRIKKDNIIDLISSDAVWTSDKAMVIKELLQNAVEACRYRAYNSSQADNYTPQITVTFLRDKKEITIEDNGCGMSRQVILNNFLTVGNSRSFDPTYNSSSYASLARFGIGFWSVFTIAKKANIETAPFEHNINGTSDGLNFDVSIEEFKDYTIFHKTHRKAGTKIILYIKPETNLDDIYLKLDQHIVCSEIPVTLINGDEQRNIPQKISLPEFSKLFGPKTDYAKKIGVKAFFKEFDTEFLTLKMMITYLVDNDEICFNTEKGRESIIHLLMDNRDPFENLSVCGFTVRGSFLSACFDLGRVGKYLVNVKSPKGFNFQLNRRSLLPSDEYKQLINLINDYVHAGYREFLQSLKQYNAKGIFETNLRSRANGGNVYSQYTGNRLEKYWNEIPDLTCFKLYKIKKDEDYSTCEKIYLTIDELVKKDFRLWSYQSQQFLSKGRYFDPERSQPLIYEIIKNTFELENDYLLELSIEASMLFDNDPLGSIFIQKVQFQDASEQMDVPLIVCNSKISKGIHHDSIIGKVHGSWSGNIYDRQITGANFSFLGQHRFVVKTDSLLAKEIKLMLEDGAHLRLCNLINLFKNAESGFVDSSIAKYI